MKTKPSLRRDSLAQKRPGRLGDIEKAARKEAQAVAHPAIYGWCKSEGDGIKEPGISQLQDDIAKALVRFAQRHGAKVRRETQKPFVEYLNGYLQGHSPGSYDGDACVRCESIREFLKRTLTPRGPERRK